MAKDNKESLHLDPELLFLVVAAIKERTGSVEEARKAISEVLSDPEILQALSKKEEITPSVRVGAIPLNRPLNRLGAR